ncbi:beta-galactosidase [Oleiharenicola lentus]|nr:beta-galactosidase [Oleiharenicola lentus]
MHPNPSDPSAPPPRPWHDGSILLGTVYNVFHSEYATDEEFFARVDTDLAAIRAANIRHLLVFPLSQWDHATRRLKWERTDYLVRKIEEAGLKFVPLLLKEEQCGHYFPPWQFETLPEIRQQHHVPGPNRNNREHVDFIHPEVFPLLEDYFRAVIGRYGRSPALAFYNIWNEPHYSHQSPHVVARFGDWLQKKYGTLAELNRAWGDDFTAWEQVTPFLADDWDSSMPSIDWGLFRNELNGVILGELRAMLHRYDRSRAINANPVGTPWSNFGDFGGYNTDNWQFTAHEEFAGLSYYPDALDRPHREQPFPLWWHNLTFAVTRSAAGPKPYILTELYTNGKSGLTLGGWLDRATVWQLAWTALANDCKGLFYWKWQPFARGRQALGRGLTTMDGTLAPRGEAVRELGAVLAQWGDTLMAARLETRPVGVLLDMNGLLKCLEQNPQRGLRHFLYQSNAGLFRALDEDNHGVDFLRTDRPLDLAQLRAYRVLFLPFQIVLRRSLAPLLREYVAAGGCLVADCMTASLDELDFAYATQPGAGLDEVFGARRLDWVAEEKSHRVIWSRESGPTHFTAAVYREILQPAPGAEVLATFADTGTPAAVRHRHGLGQTLLLGFALGGTLHTDPGSPLRSLLHGWLRPLLGPAAFTWAGAGAPPMIRRHERGRDQVFYLINPAATTVEGTLSVPVTGAVTVETLVGPKACSVQPADGTSSLRLHVRLEPAGVLVLLLHPA